MAAISFDPRTAAPKLSPCVPPRGHLTLTLREISRALGGEICNGQVLAPGPGHSKIDRSLAVRPAPQSSNGFVLHSFAGDDWRDCLDYVRQRLDLSDWRDNPSAEMAPRPTPKPERADRDRRDLARRIFAESVDLRGTLGERYLAVERGLQIIDDVLAMTVRFHRACPFRDGDKLVKAPALVCAVRSLRTVLGAAQALGELEKVERDILCDPKHVCAIQRIRLTEDGKKVERRSLGAMGDDGAVLCSSLWDLFYSSHATVAEGVETALSMKALGFDGCIAAAGVGRFKNFAPPFHITSITVSGENDGGASSNGWRDAGPRWAAEGREVIVWAPPGEMKDANDILITEARAR